MTTKTFTQPHHTHTVHADVRDSCGTHNHLHAARVGASPSTTPAEAVTAPKPGRQAVTGSDTTGCTGPTQCTHNYCGPLCELRRKQLERYHARTALRLCTQCAQPARRGGVKCTPCETKNRDTTRALRAQAHQTNKCARCLQRAPRRGLKVCHRCRADLDTYKHAGSYTAGRKRANRGRST